MKFFVLSLTLLSLCNLATAGSQYQALLKQFSAVSGGKKIECWGVGDNQQEEKCLASLRTAVEVARHGAFPKGYLGAKVILQYTCSELADMNGDVCITAGLDANALIAFFKTQAFDFAKLAALKAKIRKANGWNIVFTTQTNKGGFELLQTLADMPPEFKLSRKAVDTILVDYEWKNVDFYGNITIDVAAKRDDIANHFFSQK